MSISKSYIINMSLKAKQKQTSSTYLTNIKSTDIGISLIGSALMASTTYYAKPINQIPLIYGQLHNWIDTLEDKVKVLLEKQSLQIQFAYKNHLVQLKKQLSQLKARSEQQQKSFNENVRIQYFERQMIIFREEAISCSQQLQVSRQKVEKLKFMLDFANEQILQKNEQIKKLMKVAKYQDGEIQILKKQINAQKNDQQFQNNPFNKTSSQLSTQLKNSIFPSTNRQTINKTNSIQSREKLKVYGQQKCIKQEDSLHINKQKNLKKRLSYHKNRQQQVQSPIMISKRKHHTFGLLCQFEVQNWFLECVKSVKNDVMHRKMSYTSNKNYSTQNWMSNISSLQDFKAIDKHRILQIFVTNNNIIQLIYSKLKNYQSASIYMRTQQKSQTQQTHRFKTSNSQINNQNNISQIKDHQNQQPKPQILNKQTESRTDHPDKVKKLKAAQIFQMERVGLKIKYRKNQKNIVKKGQALRTLVD